MTDRELLEQLLAKVTSIESDIASMKTDITSMKTDIASTKTDIVEMKGDIQNLKQGQEEIKDHLIQMDTRNAENHIGIKGQLDKLSNDVTLIKEEFNILEGVAKQNSFDIAHLKAIK